MHRSRELRTCLGSFPTGVSVVTVRRDDVVRGATVSSFTSVSLTPPLVVVSLNRRSRICAHLDGAPFGVNILAGHQHDLARHFAGQRTARPALIGWERSTLAPRLAGCVGYLACTPWASYDGGDHVMFVGEVRHFELRGGEPLVVHRGAFRELGPAREPEPWIGSLDSPDNGYVERLAR